MTEDQKRYIYDAVMEKVSQFAKEMFHINEGRPAKWTEETIRAYMEEHPEIRTIGQLNRAEPGVYSAANRLGILDDVFTTRQQKPYTRAEIKGYLKRHPEIKTPMDFSNKRYGMYQAAWRLGMMVDLFPDARRYERKQVSPEEKAKDDIETELKKGYSDALQKIKTEKSKDRETSELWFPSKDDFDIYAFKKDYDAFLRLNGFRSMIDYRAEVLKNSISKKEYIEQAVEKKQKELADRSYDGGYRNFYRQISISSEDLSPEEIIRKTRISAARKWEDMIDYKTRQLEDKYKDEKNELKLFVLFKYERLPHLLMNNEKFQEKYADELKFRDYVLDNEYVQKMYRKFFVYNKGIDENVWTIEQFLKMWIFRSLDIKENEDDSRYGTSKTKYYQDEIDELRDRFSR